MTDFDDQNLEAIMQEAALWQVRLENGTCSTADFETWRGTDPRHAAAYARMLGTTAELGLVKAQVAQEVGSRPNEKVNFGRRGLLSLGLVAAGAATVGGGLFAYLKAQPATAETRVGDRQSLTLPDGGRVELNTDTKVAWRYTSHDRSIWLRQGEIAVHVPQDPRKCTIHVGEREVWAETGDFNIRMLGDAVEVVTLAGECQLWTPRPKAPPNTIIDDEAPVAIPAGHALKPDTSGRYAAAPVDRQGLQAATAWQSDELIFTGESLESAVAEYNRYLTRKIVVTDPALKDLRLGGRFGTHDSKEFLQALNSAFNIKAQDMGEVTILAR